MSSPTNESVRRGGQGVEDVVTHEVHLRAVDDWLEDVGHHLRIDSSCKQNRVRSELNRVRSETVSA